MFETGVRQFRLALGLVAGRRIDPGNVARLVDDVLATLAEFGEPGADAAELIDGPTTSPEAQLETANRGLRRTARRLAAQSPFYARRFAAAGTDLARFGLAGLRQVPVTVKADLTERPGDFRCADVPPYLATRTTGTTGRPTEVWLSRYEMELWPALGALASVLRDELRPGDVMQVNLSSRSTAALHLAAASCRLVGAGCRPLGIVPPEAALDALADGGTTILLSCPSYLAELVNEARRRGLGAGDFRLRRIVVGGEVLSPSLARAAARAFGVTAVEDPYSMTEIAPVSGRTCRQGHQHYDLNLGYTELIDLDTGELAAPGALGTLVVTPYFPYRDCTPVFRYDTRDVARCLPDGPLSCELAGVPATSQIVGKANQLLRLHDGEVITPRQLIEAIEALPGEPWPARYRATADGDRIRLALPASAIAGYGHAEAERHFAAAGLGADLDIVPDDQGAALRHTRSDLHETMFASQHALAGA
ncbi:MAG TPA: AMP-binding protein [Trebonia sp.]|jgi:phenylacetate-coenzyme A ligase PaaK-like adenylate-forming protein|nr:AMP-binding protein [Trebonia sp.]